MNRLLRKVGVAVGALGALVVALLLIAQRLPLRSETLRQRIASTLAWRLGRDVTLDDVSLLLLPHPRVAGRGLVVHDLRRREVPPLISIASFTVDTSLIGLIRGRVDQVAITGLKITLSPDAPDDEGSPSSAESSPSSPASGPAIDSLQEGLVIDLLDSRDAELIIIPRTPGKPPHVWSLHALRMHDVGVGRSMPFEATLNNAIPPGEIKTIGRFGPWDREDPRDTPLKGTFAFANADLSVFHGIAGTLAAHGSFGGTLGRIDVNGETDTPDFTIKVGGHPFALHAKYHTIVDGTKGDTRLERIDGRFLQSSLVARGSVLDEPRAHGRTVALDIDMPTARIEDVVQMAVKAPKPPMTGALKLTTKFLLPPGETDVADRLKLDGRFAIGRVHFTRYDVQAKIDELSHRSRGRAAGGQAEGVVSDFKGRFLLADGSLRLPQLTFDVPGAEVDLRGAYALKAETLDFRGTLQMDARISQTQTGFKALLLKAVDPLFRKPGGGSAVPIRISGRRENPQFGVDVGRFFKRGDDF